MMQRILRQIKTRYKTWDRGKGKSSDLFIDLLDKDATFRSIGGGVDAMQFTRTHSTKEKIRAYFEGLALDWQMIFYNVRMFLVAGDTIAVTSPWCGNALHDAWLLPGTKYRRCCGWSVATQAAPPLAPNSGHVIARDASTTPSTMTPEPSA